MAFTLSQQHPAPLLFGGIGAVLVVASVVGLALKRRIAPDRPHAVIDNLNARIKAWWVMVALVAVSAAAGRGGTLLLYALASFFALREFVAVAPTARGDRTALLLAFAVVLPAQYAFIWIGWYGMYSVFIPVYAFLFLPIVAALSSETRNFLARAAVLQWGLMISVFCISHVPALLTLEIPGYAGQNLLLLVFMIVVVQASDVLQYVWGKLLGRHTIAPELSPSKTVEGFAGGVLSASALGTALWWITPFSPWQAFVIALVLTLMGFLGGLVMSAVKRDRGVKDWGSLIEGHGGMLDRLDSVCFAAPIFFHVTRFWWTP
jgi:phosphatidate cytidylyltransferase